MLVTVVRSVVVDVVVVVDHKVVLEITVTGYEDTIVTFRVLVYVKRSMQVVVVVIRDVAVVVKVASVE